MRSTEPARTNAPSTLKQRWNDFYHRVKSLQGDPHYVAMGMAIGVFVSITPTIPFHMILAVAMAFVLKGSKPAAILGAWFCNPLTIGPIYYGCYKLGMYMLGREMVISDFDQISFQELLSLGTDVAIAMVLGGALLGIVPAIFSYFFTYYMFRKIRSRRKEKRALKEGGLDKTAAAPDAATAPDTDPTQTP